MNPSLARLTFATFPPDLKSAMKTAAVRFEWQAEDWPFHISLIQDALLAGRVTYDEMIAGYRHALEKTS